MIEGTNGVPPNDSALPVGLESLLAERAVENTVIHPLLFSAVEEMPDAVVENSADSVEESTSVRRSSESL